MYWDYTYILVLVGALICGAASLNVNRTFKKFSKFSNRRGLSSQAVATMILQSAGIYDVKIELVRGNLTDHYSPKEKVLRLSESVYDSTSVAAIGVAAHECGHAIQHSTEYFPLKLRTFSVPIAKFGSWVSWPVIVLGLIFGAFNLARIGVFLFTFVVLFQLITLPVEFNASSRAIEIMEQSGILSGDELAGASKVLRAAAMTYVASLFSTILQLLRLVMLVGRRRD